MLKKLKTNKGIALAIALVLSVTGVLVAIGSILASQEVIWEATLPANIGADATVDVSDSDGKGGKLTLTGNSAITWGSTNTGVASQSGGGAGRAEFTARNPGFFSAYRSTRAGSMGITNAAVYDSTMPTSYRITKNHSAIRREGQTDTVPITMWDMDKNVITNAITWVSDAPSVATVDANSGEITAVSNSGTANIIGQFIDCYGQEQSIHYSAVIGILDTDEIIGPDDDGNYWKSVDEPPYVWQQVEENGVPKNPLEYTYDRDGQGPKDPTNPSIPLVKGNDGNYYVKAEAPTNIFTPILPDGSIGGESDKIWGGPDGKPGTNDDEDVENFGSTTNPDYWASFGQNIYARIRANGSISEQVGGGTDYDPMTSPVTPILDNRANDGYFYYGPLDDSQTGVSYYVGDKRPTGGDGFVTSNLAPATMHGSDQRYYRDQNNNMVTILPVAATGIDMDTYDRVVRNSMEAPPATVQPANATNKVIKWSSSDTSVARVDENTGQVSAVKYEESAIITATVTNEDGSEVTASYKVINSDGRGTVGNRVLGNAQTGDGNWIEIGRIGDYSLILRTEVVASSRFSVGVSSSQVSYSAQDRNDDRNLRYAVNNWYEGQLSANARLRNYVVNHDAVNRLGVWSSQTTSGGLSVPKGGAPATGGDIAFPLSSQEAARYCSLGWHNGSNVTRTSDEARANWEKLTYEGTGEGTNDWLRTPGGNNLSPSTIQSRSGSVTGVFGWFGSDEMVRPALWVKSSIFN